ncbi:hypothetical protein ACFX1T_020258 [Malus domestica]
MEIKRKKQIQEQEEEEKRRRVKSLEVEEELSRNQQVRNSKDGSEVDDWGTMYNKAAAEITPQGNEMIFKKKRVKESLDSAVVAHQSVNGRRIRCIKESLTV